MLLKPAGAQQLNGLQTNIIVEKTENEADFPIVGVNSSSASIFYENNDYKGVLGVSPWYWWTDVPVKKRSAGLRTDLS